MRATIAAAALAISAVSASASPAYVCSSTEAVGFPSEDDLWSDDTARAMRSFMVKPVTSAGRLGVFVVGGGEAPVSLCLDPSAGGVTTCNGVVHFKLFAEPMAFVAAQFGTPGRDALAVPARLETGRCSPLD